MANLAKRYELDPELAALYGPEEPRAHEPEVIARPHAESEPESEPESGEKDPLLELQEIAERNRKNHRPRSELRPGFDTVENDLSNVVKTCFDFVTRPIGK